MKAYKQEIRIGVEIIYIEDMGIQVHKIHLNIYFIVEVKIFLVLVVLNQELVSDILLYIMIKMRIIRIYIKGIGNNRDKVIIVGINFVQIIEEINLENLIDIDIKV